MDDEAFIKLNEILKIKDPIINKPLETPSENMPLSSKDSKEIIKAKTSKPF